MAVLQHAQLESALARALAVAQCLCTLHASQQIHSGLSPQAVQLLPDARVRLHPAPPAGQALSLQALRYASPEQAGRLALVDTRSDLYSLGLLLYEWLLDQVAFDCGDALELAYRQMSLLPRAPHTLNAGVPLQVSELVMRRLAKSPDARYASAQGLTDDLQRCLRALADSGQVTRFALAQTDLRSQFIIPEQLYGRAGEMATLVQLWQRTVHGELLLCLVSGSAGMGKTALVRALRNTVQSGGGRWVEGRSEARQHRFPGLALVDAFKTLLRQLLAGAPAERARWRSRLLTGLGHHLAVVQELLPEMEWITGRQPPAPLLVGLAVRRRMSAALVDLLALFAGPEHPLLLFLEDLHWGDAATLAFIRALLRERRCSHVLLVGAYRDGPCDSTTALTRLLHELHKGHAHLNEIRLKPLAMEELAALIDDTCSKVNALPALTSLVMQETQGKPQQARHFLQALVAQGRLRYVPLVQCWRWSPDQGVAAPNPLWWT
jgi:hypothetical protein